MIMNLTELKKQSAVELMSLAQALNLEGTARSRKQDIIFALLKAHAKKGEDICFLNKTSAEKILSEIEE